MKDKRLSRESMLTSTLDGGLVISRWDSFDWEMEKVDFYQLWDY